MANVRRLVEAGVVPGIASELAAQMDGTFLGQASVDAAVAAGVGFVDPLARNDRNRRSITSFGVQLNTQQDQTAKVNDALSSGEALWMPPGDIWVGDSCILRTQTNLAGSGPLRSRFRPLPGATADVFTIPAGQVRYLTLRDFGVEGLAANTGQRGMVFVARPDGGGNGGVWEAVFENIRIRGFTGISMAWLGYTTLGIAPHQWLKLTMVDVERPTTGSDLGLYMHGQCEHFHFDSCRFDGNGAGTQAYGGQNIYIGRSFAASEGVVGPYGTGTPISDFAPKLVLFTNLTCQAATLGVCVDRSDRTSFKDSWFEDLVNGIQAKNTAKVIEGGNLFADAGNGGKTIESLSSAIILPGGGQSLYIGTNTIANTTDGSGSILPNSVGNLATNNVYHTRVLGSRPSNGQVDIGVVPGLNLSVTATGIVFSQFSSSAPSGHVISVTNNGSIAYGFDNAGSGTLGFNLGVGVTSITLNAGETMFFRKSQRGGGKGWDMLPGKI